MTVVTVYVGLEYNRSTFGGGKSTAKVQLPTGIGSMYQVLEITAKTTMMMIARKLMPLTLQHWLCMISRIIILPCRSVDAGIVVSQNAGR